MTPFTDEDLKRLKDSLSLAEGRYSAISIEQLQALLARLEAAERFRECWLHTRQFKHSEEGYKCGLCEEFERVDEVWRKAAGK